MYENTASQKYVYLYTFVSHLPLGKNLLGSKRKAINIYFAFILQVL